MEGLIELLVCDFLRNTYFLFGNHTFLGGGTQQVARKGKQVEPGKSQGGILSSKGV